MEVLVCIILNTSLNYLVLEKTFNEAFQALWIELEFLKGKNVICGVIYRQHNSPEQFQAYFEMTLERLSSTNKPIYYIDESVLLGTKPLVDSIRHFIRDLSGIFSVCHL